MGTLSPWRHSRHRHPYCKETGKQPLATSSVIWHVTMSLDGFIAKRDDSMDWVVAQWSDAARPPATSMCSAPPSLTRCCSGGGAILGGRRWYDVGVRKFG